MTGILQLLVIVFFLLVVYGIVINRVSKEMVDLFNFPGSFYEDEKYVYYNKITKNNLLSWAGTYAP